MDAHQMADYQFTGYFLNEVLLKRPYIKTEWCIFVIETPSIPSRRRPIGGGFGPQFPSWPPVPAGGGAGV